MIYKSEEFLDASALHKDAPRVNLANSANIFRSCELSVALAFFPAFVNLFLREGFNDVEPAWTSLPNVVHIVKRSAWKKFMEDF